MLKRVTFPIIEKSPPTKIRPSVCLANALTAPFAPLGIKPLSKAPFGRSRAKFKRGALLTDAKSPPTRMLPSGCARI
jgi:hypothetical protein